MDQRATSDADTDSQCPLLRHTLRGRPPSDCTLPAYPSPRRILACSDYCLLDLVEQLTRNFLEQSPASTEVSSLPSSSASANSSVVWPAVVRQYTQSLCQELHALVTTNKTNPIAVLVSAVKTPPRGHDLHTRIAMLRVLVSKIRCWAELLHGLPQEKVACDPAQSEAEETASGDSYGAVLAPLLDTLESAGALDLLSEKDLSQTSVSSSLEVVRWIDESLRSDAWTKKQCGGKRKRASCSKQTSVEHRRLPRSNEVIASDNNCAQRNSLDHAPCREDVTSPYACCLVKGCRRAGTLSCSGMCRHHSAKHERPHPFQWDKVLPPATARHIMQRLRRRCVGPKDNIHGAIIGELRRLVARTGANGTFGHLAVATEQATAGSLTGGAEDLDRL